MVHYRHIVVGSGGIGSATAWWLADRSGGDVLVLEQFALGHEFGSSQDHSRIIRYAYNTVEYTQLVEANYATWFDVERRSGEQLVFKTGGLDLSPGAFGEGQIAAYADALDAVGIPSKKMDAAEITSNWPQWTLADDVVGLYQKDAGVLAIGKANATHRALAREAGATFLPNTPVRRLVSIGNHVEVHTDEDVFTADSVALAAGSWTVPLTETLGVSFPILLSQEQLTYFASPHLDEFARDRFPIWIWHGENDCYYGLPVYGAQGVKAGIDISGKVVTQETRTWDPDPAQRARLTGWLTEHLPRAVGPELYTKACVYDLPPDRNFILDLLPGHPRVALFVGAGHAAKFASFAGRLLADLAADGGTKYPIDAFSATRAALTDPDYPVDYLFAGH
ncbi:N-methyl-L-tryptophan oxidase [Cryptosporangium phraense]|uniref:N-methyl-L-tryptophan oxidase n=1 Tax=Cryptosporangium phraense TaxID=2593070 RepID=A0A545AGE4_9ACTN|nr:N-methyl-L-tryptophan oxidase [Cryptosporangium phraense]TQS40350.1 N-methyl-L-tryptophan oxidase [Cryptosporangium phraense]